MKNFKLTTAFLAIVVLIIAGTLNSNANDIMHDENIEPLNTDLHFEILDIMNKYKASTETLVVEIYDPNGITIAFGEFNDRNLRTIIENSDFLTEINGKKYYILSFE